MASLTKVLAAVKAISESIAVLNDAGIDVDHMSGHGHKGPQVRDINNAVGAIASSALDVASRDSSPSSGKPKSKGLSEITPRQLPVRPKGRTSKK